MPDVPSPTGRWLVHAMGQCLTCGKEFTARNAQGLAAQHARKYGHEVMGELGYAFRYTGAS